MRWRWGLLIDHLDLEDTYQDLVWRTAQRQAALDDVDLVVFPARGSHLISRSDRSDLPLYRLAASAGLDGLLVSPTAVFALSPAEREALYVTTSALPRVTFSLPWSDVPRIDIDNQPGVRALLLHLINHHGRQRIAMLRAPAGHDEGDQRWRQWKAVLAEQGWPHDDSWTQLGNFLITGVDDQVRALWTATRGFDALFCFNDAMALAAIEALRRQGHRVPEDVSVVGFDDTGRARAAHPPLTTVHQPIDKQMARAFQWLRAWKEGTPPPSREILSTTLVIRGSCGCLEPSWTRLCPTEATLPRQPAVRAADPDAVDEWLGQKAPTEAELSALEDLWHRDNRPLPERLRRDVDRYRWNASRERLVAVEGRIDHLQNIERALTVDLPTAELAKRLTSDAHVLGFTQWMVARVPPVEDEWEEISGPLPTAPAVFECVAASARQAVGHRFSSVQLAPPSWWAAFQGGTVVAFPLVVGSQWFGLVLLDVAEGNTVVARGFQHQLAAHFYRQFHLRRMVDERLALELQSQVEREKMQALTTLVSGVSHEMNTPVGNSMTAVTYLQDMVADPLALARAAPDALALILRGLTKTSELVQQFRRVVPWTGGEVETFDLAAHLGEVLLELDHRGVAPSLTVDGPPPVPLMVTTAVSPFVEILEQLLINAEQHAYEGQPGVVRVILELMNPFEVRLEVADRGRGIPDDLVPHVFEPFFTTKRGHNTGLGLHILYNQVKDGLQGTASCSSHVGLGTSVTLTFPRERQNS